MKAKAVIAAIIVMVFAGCATAPKPTADVQPPQQVAQKESKLHDAWEWFKENFQSISAGAAIDTVLWP